MSLLNKKNLKRTFFATGMWFCASFASNYTIHAVDYIWSGMELAKEPFLIYPKEGVIHTPYGEDLREYQKKTKESMFIGLHEENSFVKNLTSLNPMLFVPGSFLWERTERPNESLKNIPQSENIKKTSLERLGSQKSLEEFG